MYALNSVHYLLEVFFFTGVARFFLLAEELLRLPTDNVSLIVDDFFDLVIVALLVLLEARWCCLDAEEVVFLVAKILTGFDVDAFLALFKDGGRAPLFLVPITFLRSFSVDSLGLRFLIAADVVFVLLLLLLWKFAKSSCICFSSAAAFFEAFRSTLMTTLGVFFVVSTTSSFFSSAFSLVLLRRGGCSWSSKIHFFS